MITLTINRDQLVAKLLELYHVSHPRDQKPYRVAFNPYWLQNGVVVARVIWANTPSTVEPNMFFSNYVGEVNIFPQDFLVEEGNDYTWGEGEGEFHDRASLNAAGDWITENLVPVIETEWGVFDVKYI